MLSVALLAIAGPLGAQTSEEYRRVLAPAEAIRPAPLHAELVVKDLRSFQSNGASLSALGEMLEIHFQSAATSLPGPIQERMRAVIVQLDVSFLGLLRMESGSWSARSSMEVTVRDPYASRVLATKSITTDRFLGRKDIGKRSVRAAIDSQLLSDAFRRIAAVTDSAFLVAQDDYRIATAVGVTRIDGRSEIELLKAASLDALRSASIKAWGLDVESVDQLVDLADFTSTTRSRSSGTVLAYEADRTLTKRTNDGMLVTIVTALLARPRSTRQ